MLVKNILDDAHKHPITIENTQTVGEAMASLDNHKIGALVVLNDEKKIIGIITERDIFRLVYKYDQDAKEKTINDYMSTNLIIGVPEDNLEYIAKLMTHKKIRHIPIIDKSSRLCGIVSIGDIVKARLDSAEFEVRYLKEYISGSQILKD